MDDVLDVLYLCGIARMPTMSDVLTSLKEQLQREEEAMQKAALSVQQLRIAIEAIERDMSKREPSQRARSPGKKRGALSRAVIDCIRRGIGTVAAIRKDMEEGGMTTSAGSISNAIHRLQAKKVVAFDHRRNCWAIVGDGASESNPRPADRAQNDEGPTGEPERPLVRNGAADLHSA